MIKVPKAIKIILPRANETLTRVKTNKFEDVTCAKNKSVMPRLTIDGVRAAPEQVKCHRTDQFIRVQVQW